MKIAFLSCSVTLPGSPNRRPDAHEHDYQVAALKPPLRALGHELVEVDWRDADLCSHGFDAALIGTTWDYWDYQEAFLVTLARFEAVCGPVFNPASLVRWNSRKTYLQTLADRGVATIPTLWLDNPSAETLASAFDTLGSDDIVVKRQVGAGAFDQKRLKRGERIEDYPFAAMVQPFLPVIQSEGEFSFVMIDGDLSHALIKEAKPGDYRIQSMYGGVETAITPTPADLAAAKAVLETLDELPLYARVDMVRGADGALLLMELELIEPYLYPEQGPDLGQMLAQALHKRLSP